MKVAAVQLNSTSDKDENVASAERHIRAAAADGAQLIVLPEKWTAMGGVSQLKASAEPLEGPTLAWAMSIATELSIDLIAGSIVERECGQEREQGRERGGEREGAGGQEGKGEWEGEQDGEGEWEGEESFANTSVHVGPDGEVKAVYRKIHMFDVEVEGRVYRESDLERPGSEIVLSETASGLPLGLSICYDLRFPELFRILALRGARLIALPSAFTLRTTRDHWETLICARAIENQAFLIAANQVGRHPGDHESGGRSMIVDPWGRILGRLGEREQGYVLATLDLREQEQIRSKLPSLAHRRPGAYRWPEQSAIAQRAGGA